MNPKDRMPSLISVLITFALDILIDYVTFKVAEVYNKQCSGSINADSINGPLKGIVRSIFNGEKVFSFENIPYAKPPVGELRFMDPEPHEDWVKRRSCMAEGPMPLQENLFTHRVAGSEDCLYLNIYTKTVVPEASQPVIAFISCGGFEIGGTTRTLFGGDFLLESNIVFVTISFRLGAMGFLSMDDSSLHVPGNAGLKDIVLALKWIKRNIRNFGGNPQNVTLMGHSGGAACVHLLMGCETARGLFEKAILMSGSALSDWSRIRDNHWCHQLAQLAGYKGQLEDKKVFKYLQNIRATKIIQAEMRLRSREDAENGILFKIGPSIETYETGNAIIGPTQRSARANIMGWASNIPIIIGGVSNEGLVLKSDVELHPMQMQAMNATLCTSPEDRVNRTPYYANQVLTRKPEVAEFVEILSCKHFWNGIYQTVMAYFMSSNKNVFLYRFDVDSDKFNRFRQMIGAKNEDGACHGDDLCYLFYNMFSRKVNKKCPEYKIIQLLTKSWTEFARTGNPNCPSMTQYPVWLPVKGDPPDCYNISEKEVRLIPLPEIERITPWRTMCPMDFKLPS